MLSTTQMAVHHLDYLKHLDYFNVFPYKNGNFSVEHRRPSQYVIRQSTNYARRLVENNRKDKKVVTSIVGAMGPKLYSIRNSQASKPRCKCRIKEEYVNNCG